MFQSFLCRGLAPRVLRLMVSDVESFKEYGMQFERSGNVEHCYVLCWDGLNLKKICVGGQSLDQKMPEPELLPLASVANCLEGRQLPVSVLGASPSLIRVLDTNRTDDRRFLSWQSFDEEVFLQCFRQSHQDIFGMVEVTTALEYVIHRLKWALYEDWTEDRPLLRACIREGSVAFCNLREILSDLIELWPSIRPYIRYTGHPHFKSVADRVSTIVLLVDFNFVLFFCSPLCFSCAIYDFGIKV